MSAESTALIDLAEGRVYAVKFEVNTNTGRSVQTLPLFSWKGNELLRQKE